MNLLARLAEDKSSDELRRLFGRVLAGEVKKPGSFSLRTIQLQSTLSKDEADLVSKFLSFAVLKRIVPFSKFDEPGISHAMRLMMEELGIAGHPTEIGGMSLTATVGAHQSFPVDATDLGLIIENNSDAEIAVKIHGQLLTTAGAELFLIAHSPPTTKGFIKELGRSIYDSLSERRKAELLSGEIKIHIAKLVPRGSKRFTADLLEVISKSEDK